MPKRLWTIEEASNYLKISEEEVKRLVDIGELPAYRIGDTFLRFRKEQLDGVRKEIDLVESEDPERGKAVPDTAGHVPHPYTKLEKEIKQREPLVRRYDYSFVERVSDFFYYNDFYLLSLVLIGAIVYLIVKA